MRDKKPELLVPAGGLDTLKVAVDYGADAVYIGGQAFGLRAKADNFSIEEMKQSLFWRAERYRCGRCSCIRSGRVYNSS